MWFFLLGLGLVVLLAASRSAAAPSPQTPGALPPPPPSPQGQMILKGTVQDSAATLLIANPLPATGSNSVVSAVLSAGLDLAVFKADPVSVTTWRTLFQQEPAILGDKIAGVLLLPTIPSTSKFPNMPSDTVQVWAVFLGTMPNTMFPIRIPGFATITLTQGVAPL